MTINNLRAEHRTTPIVYRRVALGPRWRVGRRTIYQGILAITSQPTLRAFAEEYLATERQHLQIMTSLLSKSSARDCNGPAHRGLAHGALPARISAQWVYATIHTVETFVAHYQQITRLKTELPTHPIGMLERCRADEVMHRDAAARMEDKLSSP